MKFKSLIIGTLTCLFTAGANATPIDTSGSGSLQAALDGITVGGSFLDVNTNQYLPDEMWQLASSGAGNARMLFELAGNAPYNVFGIYDLSDTSNRLTVFNGANDSGDLVQVSRVGSTFTAIQTSPLTELLNVLGSATFSSETFGFFLDSRAGTGGGLFFSRESDNSDVASGPFGGHSDHMVAFAGDGSLTLNTPGVGAGLFDDGEFIIAFEDLLFPNSDYDFSDMVVLVESFVPVPEPGILGLLGLGLIGCGLARRRGKI